MNNTVLCGNIFFQHFGISYIKPCVLSGRIEVIEISSSYVFLLKIVIGEVWNILVIVFKTGVASIAVAGNCFESLAIGKCICIEARVVCSAAPEGKIWHPAGIG